jgi:hypothetical protein
LTKREKTVKLRSSLTPDREVWRYFFVILQYGKIEVNGAGVLYEMYEKNNIKYIAGPLYLQAL